MSPYLSKPINKQTFFVQGGRRFSPTDSRSSTQPTVDLQSLSSYLAGTRTRSPWLGAQDFPLWPVRLVLEASWEGAEAYVVPVGRRASRYDQRL